MRLRFRSTAPRARRALRGVAGGLALLAGWMALGDSLGASPPQRGGRRPAPPPNIVIVIADDLGYGDVGYNGAPTISTPRLDRMAAEGMRSSAFYTAYSCSPTRAEMLTGSYCTRVDVRAPLGSWSDLGLATSEYTAAEMLRDSGYRTGLFGKWHLGDSPDQLPTSQGFDEAFYSAWGLPARPHLLIDSLGPDVIDSDPVEWTPRFVDRTLAFIDGAVQSGVPFFAVLSHTSPHLPATPSPDFVGRSADGREYGDSVEEIDVSVGRVLDRLDGLGVGSNTLVLFFSDNGPALGQGAYQAGSAGPLSGGKGTTLEGGIRSPFVARWPGVIPSGVNSDVPIHVVDLFDTFAAMANKPLAASLPVRDGIDISNVLRGGPGDPQRVVHHFLNRRLEAVRQGRWKLRNGALYDMAVDEAEQNDVALQHPAVVQSLTALQVAKEAEVLASVRPRGITQRRSPQWRANAGITTGLTDGSVWRDRLQRADPWLVDDTNALESFELVSTSATQGDELPSRAVRLAAYAPDVVMRRSGVDLGVAAPGLPFALEVWARSLTDDPANDSVWFDAGDSLQGTSLTVGDAGALGDDPAPGRRDDLIVRIGGAFSTSSVSLIADLPSGADGWSDEFVHVLVTYDSGAEATLWINGFAAATAQAPGLNPGLASDWVLFGAAGGMGGSAGPGVLPFPATSFRGEIAEIRAYDRTLSRKEIEMALCRHVVYSYCAPLPDAQGNRVRFDLVGDFRSDTRDLRVEVTGVPPGTLGRVIYSPHQTRMPALGGYLCVQKRVAAPTTPFVVGTGQAGPLSGGFSLLGGLPFDPLPATSWNFQLWLWDAGRLRFSNALRVLFCP